MKRIVPLLLLLFASASAFAGDGIIMLSSAHNVSTTADRLVTALESKGMKIFTRIDHAKGAASVDKELRPTQLVIFGNPKVGTPLMQCAQSAAIDLPQKALIWEDAGRKVWLSHNDPTHLAKRHSIQGCDKVLTKVGSALGNFAKAATQP